MAYKKRIAGITIELDGDTSKLVKSLDQVSRKVEGVGKKIEGVGKDLTTHLTVPIVTAAGVAVGKFAEVDKTMTLTNQTMSNTEEEAELLNKAMQDAASNSVFGMNDAANASLNFARAGLDATEAANALAPAMNLAAGEGGDLDTVSAGLVATINGFGDSFDSAEKYADVFANACNNSALDVDSLSNAMSVAAPIFKTAGYSVEDAALYMGVMANAGIDADTAANALKTGMARLVKPAKEGAEWMEKLGINVTNADGSMKDSVQVQSELHDAFSTLSESEQIAAASAIFGKNQMSNWLALINTAPEEVDALNTSLQTEGTTAEMADAMMGGFGGSIEKLKSSLDVLMTSLGGLVAEYLTPLIEKVQGAIDKFMALDDETKDHIIKIAGIVAAVGPVLIIIGKVVTGIGSIISIASGLIAAISAINAPIVLIIAGLAALVAAGVWVYKHWDELKEGARQLAEVFSRVWGDIKQGVSDAIDSVKNKVNEMKENITQKWQDMKNAISDKWNDIKNKTTETWNNIKDSISNVVSGIKNKITEMKDSVSQKWTEMKDTISQKWNDIKQNTSDTWNAIKTKVDENGGGIMGVLKTATQGYMDLWRNAFDFIDEKTGGKLSDALNTVRDKLDSIRSFFTDTFDSVKEAVSNALDTIRDIMSGEIDFPHFNLPHFNIEGGQIPWGIGGKGSPPRISVDWYKKAMNTPYLLNGATIFGANNGSLLGGGESGSEMIIGTNKLMSMIAQAKGGSNTYNNQFVINGVDRDPQELAKEISYYLDMELQRTSGVFA